MTAAFSSEYHRRYLSKSAASSVYCEKKILKKQKQLLPFAKDASTSVFVSHVDSVSLVQLSWYLGSMIASARLPPQPIWKSIQVEAGAPRHGSVGLPTAAASCLDRRCSYIRVRGYIRVCSSPPPPLLLLPLLLMLKEEEGGRGGRRWSHRQQLICAHHRHVRHGGVKGG